MSGFANVVFCNIASVKKVELAGNWAKGLFMELEFVAVEPSFLQSRKKEEISKHPIENLSEASSQKSENPVRDELF
jgi:hypothetical protein